MNKYINNLCDAWFWRLKFGRDYVDLGPNLNYKELYHKINGFNNDVLLRFAIEHNYLALVKYALEHDATIHPEENFVLEYKLYDDAFLLAIKHGNIEIIHLLIDYNANIFTPNALYAAARRGDIDVMQLLISNGACVDAHVDLLNTAIRYGHAQLAQYLIDNHIGYIDYQTAFVETADVQNDDTKIISLLISNDSSNLFNTMKDGLLCISTTNNKLNYMKFLIDYGANDLNSAFMHAVAYKASITTLRFLLDNGANINTPDLLVHAIHRVDAIAIIQFLIECEIDFNAQCDNALFTAIRMGKLEVVRMLLAHGANIHAQDDNAFAEVHGIEMMEFLLNQGVNINAHNGAALIKASESNNISIVTWLLEHGANIHAQDDLVLIAPVKRGDIEMLRLLLNHGANVFARQDKPRRIAKERKYIDMLQLLNDHITKLEKNNITDNQCIANMKKGVRCKSIVICGTTFCIAHTNNK